MPPASKPSSGPNSTSPDVIYAAKHCIYPYQNNPALHFCRLDRSGAGGHRACRPKCTGPRAGIRDGVNSLLRGWQRPFP